MNDNQNALTQGDGNTKPDPSIDTTLNPNSTAEAATAGKLDTPDRSDGVPALQPTPPISEAKLRANRENAKKSTGPKTVRGKAYSRRNALKHGLLIRVLIYLTRPLEKRTMSSIALFGIYPRASSDRRTKGLLL